MESHGTQGRPPLAISFPVSKIKSNLSSPYDDVVPGIPGAFQVPWTGMCFVCLVRLCVCLKLNGCARLTIFHFRDEARVGPCSEGATREWPKAVGEFFGQVIPRGLCISILAGCPLHFVCFVPLAGYPCNFYLVEP